MATPVFICGGECGLATAGTDPSGTDVRHWDTVGATFTNVASTDPTGPDMAGSRTLKFNPSAAVTDFATHILQTDIASPATMVVRFTLQFTTLPNAIRTIFSDDDCRVGLRYNPTGTKLEAFAGQTASFAGSFVPSTGTTYRIELKMVRDTTHTVDWKVDGTDQTQASAGAQSASNITGFTLGSNAGNATVGNANATATYYIDDLCVSGTSGDYPIGAGTVRGLYPTADSTHSFNANNDFLRDGTTNFNTGSTNGWQEYQNPLSTTVGSFLTAANAATTEYVRHTFGDLPGDAGTINGVCGVVTVHSAATQANSATVLVIDHSATPTTPATIAQIVREFDLLGSISAGAFTGLDVSETTIQVLSKVSTAGVTTGAWTAANVNDLGLIFASIDVTPDAHLDGVCLEVDYIVSSPDATANAGVVQATATLNAAAGGASDTPDAVTPTTTLLTPAGGASDVPDAVTPTASLLTPAGGAGGTTGAMQATVTVNTPTGGTPDATANADAVTPIVTMLTPAGGASAVPAPVQAVIPWADSDSVLLADQDTVVLASQDEVQLWGNFQLIGSVTETPDPVQPTVTVPNPSSGAADATANAGVISLTGTLNQMVGSVAHEEGVIVTGVTMAGPGGTASGIPSPTTPTTNMNGPAGGAGGTTGALSRTTTLNTPAGGAAGTAGIIGLTGSQQTPAGGAGGTTGQLQITVTMNEISGAADATANAGVISPVVSLLQMIGSVAQQEGVIQVGVTMAGPGGTAQGTTQQLQRNATLNTPAGTVSATTAAISRTVTLNTPAGGAGGTTQQLQITVEMQPLPSAGGASAGVIAVTISSNTPTGGAGGTEGVISPAASLGQMTGHVSGTAATNTGGVTMAGPGGSATIQPGVITVAVTPLGLAHSVAGGASVIQAGVQLVGPAGGAGGTMTPLQVAVAMLTAVGVEVALDPGRFTIASHASARTGTYTARPITAVRASDPDTIPAHL